MHLLRIKNQTGVIRLFFSLVMIMMAVALVSCDDAKNPKKVRLDSRETLPAGNAGQPVDESLRFGFDLRLTPKEDVKIYLPFLRYLAKATGRKFTIVFTDNYEDTARYLGDGLIHFAALGPVNCLRAQKKYGTICLAVGKNRAGRPEYQAAIVVRPDSPLMTLDDLHGRTLVFGNQLSTQGYLIPRAMLDEAGVPLAALRHYSFAGSHDKVARAVLNGEYDAGAMQDVLAGQLAAQGKLKIIAISRPYPASLICANSKVDPALREKVRQALLAFDPQGKHANDLVNWEQTEMPTGFVAYNDHDFLQLRALAKRYGLVP